MGRVPSLVASALLVLVVLLLPRVDAPGLAALQCDALLTPTDAEVEAPAIGERVLAGPAVHDRGGGVRELQLGTTRLAIPGRGELDGRLHGEVRRSIIRGLRTLASQEGLTLRVDGELTPSDGPGAATFLVELEGDELTLEYAPDGSGEGPLRLTRSWKPPNRASLLPPLIAIALAILLRKPLISLFIGVVAGSVLVRHADGEGALASATAGLADVFRVYWAAQLTDRYRVEIILFVVFMLAMVGILTRAGGLAGLVRAVAKLASSARSTQVATYVMGLLVFFDDYANTVLVGSTMRPLTDRFRIAREKLAYIVDSTAAPVAGISIFSTWIAFEVSTFSAQLPSAGLTPADGYGIFLQTLPYRFYCVLTLVLVGLVTLLGRDFGPMLTAERRARSTGQLVREGGRPLVSARATTMQPAAGIEPSAWLAIGPLAVFLGVTLFEILRVGGAFGMPLGELLSLEGMTRVLYDGSGSWPLFLGSGLGMLVAAVAAIVRGVGPLDVLLAAWTTLRSMGFAILILYMAWMIGAICEALGTAPFLTALVGGALDPLILPALLFVLSGFVAFATGSSWSTMSILLPLVVGLSFGLGTETGLAETPTLSGQLLMVMSIGAVLEGAIFGDHCSPISDTTVLSSIASASDHVDHVRTQAPYALLTMLVAMAAGYLPCTYLGLNPFAGLGIGAVALTAVVLWWGRRADESTARGR